MLEIPWQALALGGTVLIAVSAGIHALLHLPDPRAAWGWIAVTLLFPVAGPVLYLLFGINRVKSRARQIATALPDELSPHAQADVRENPELRAQLSAHLSLIHTGDTVTQSPLLGGNRVRPLRNGEEAFPAMLAAIDAATESVALATYIFETNKVGRDVIQALERAKARGVDIRVLVDGIGERGGFVLTDFKPEQFTLDPAGDIYLVDGPAPNTGRVAAFARRHFVAGEHIFVGRAPRPRPSPGESVRLDLEPGLPWPCSGHGAASAAHYCAKRTYAYHHCREDCEEGSRGAPEIGVIHGWQIIVDQRIGVYEFDRRRDPGSASPVDPKQLGRLHDQKRTQPLATSQA